ncbi:MAG TPA: hypothetical protein VFI65_15780 [Streptosporangiaceae bacterium]|nr:hypothetical protein [Streptosporangiaceae bacterium]
MTESGLTLNASSAYIADKLNIFITEDFVDVTPIPDSDCAACAQGRFVQPTGEWPAAWARLREHRVVVILGVPGCGRRTAALKLLLGVTPSVHELSQAWGRPRTKILRLAAQKMSADNGILADAVGNLAAHYPQKLLLAIAHWFASPASVGAGISVFLALSSRLDGAMLLCKQAHHAIYDPSFSDTLASYFHRALTDNHSGKKAFSVALAWGAHSGAGDLDSELTTRVFAAALASSVKGSLFRQFPDVGDYSTYWGRVYHEAVSLADRHDREVTAQLGDLSYANGQARPVPDHAQAEVPEGGGLAMYPANGNCIITQPDREVAANGSLNGDLA